MTVTPRGDDDDTQPVHHSGASPWHPEPAYPQPPVTVWNAPRPPSNGLATASGVCGIVGAAISWIPFINLFALVLALIAVALGGVGLARANRYAKDGQEPAGRGMAITGIVLGCAGLLIAFLLIAALGSVLSGTTST